MVVLVSATWAGPSRPAPTVLRELQRRWGTRVDAVLIEDPDDAVIDALRIEIVPTWLRLEPAPDEAISDSTAPAGQNQPSQQRSLAHRDERSGSTRAEGGGPVPRPAAMRLEVEAVSPLGGTLTIAGAWVETHRRTGALPKHLIDHEFGPAVDNAR